MTIAEKLQTIAENEPKVYDAGRTKGYNEGYADGTSGTAFETDASIAYRKIVPSASEMYAQVLKVGGMSYKTDNLIPFPYSVIGDVGTSTTKAGITCTVGNNREVIFNGTPDVTYATYFDIAKVSLRAGTYNLSVGDYKGSSSTVQVTILNDTGSEALSVEMVYMASYTNRKFTVVNDGSVIIRVYVYKNTTLDNVKFHFMLNEGETALPYESFFEGIRDAKVTEFVSEGQNLFDISQALNDCLVDNGDGTYTISNNGGNNRFSAKVPLFIPANTPFSVKGTKISDITSAFVITFADMADKAFRIDGLERNLIFASDVTSIRLYVEIQNEGQSATFADFQIEYGTTATEYKPYVGTISTNAIPEAIKNLDGYGLGINETYYNYIDFERKVFVQNVIKVTFDGTENWIYQDEFSRIRLFKGTIAGIDYKIPCLSNYYDFNENVYKDADRENGIIVSKDGTIFVRDDTVTNIADFKAKLAAWNAEGKPFTVLYATSNVDEIDISEYLTGNLINVQGGGTITAVNEYEFAAPTTIQYISKVGA